MVGNPRREASDDVARESWTMTNISALVFSIGDLPFVPSFGIGDSKDLLQYYSKEDIEQSVDLITIISRGWATITKVLDSNTEETITDNNANAALSTPDGTQIGAVDGFYNLEVGLGGFLSMDVGSADDRNPVESPMIADLDGNGFNISNAYVIPIYQNANASTIAATLQDGELTIGFNEGTNQFVLVAKTSTGQVYSATVAGS